MIRKLGFIHDLVHGRVGDGLARLAAPLAVPVEGQGQSAAAA